jgi:hypothetical protein
MHDQAELRHGQLLDVLHAQYGHLGITGLRPLGEGMDAKVYRACSSALGPVAVKLPHARWVSSGNEPRLDTRTLLRQELQLSQHLRAHGLPVPEVFLMHTDDAGVDFIVTEYIGSDGSELPDADFGHLIHAIHHVPVPAIDLVASKPSADADDVLSERIEQRLKKLASTTDLACGIPDISAALSADPRDTAPARLLHMDLRPANILVRSRRPVAILDWSNLARAAEYGCLTPAALAAYGPSAAFSLTPRTPREIVYRLDTAVMLSHVFSDGAPDEDKARHYIERTRTFCRALSGA